MDNAVSASADVESWTPMNYLEEGGFPALLWDTLKDFGYTTYPEYSTHEVMTTGQLSLGSEGEDFSVPDQSYLGRVGV
jgi:hypothetical protein